MSKDKGINAVSLMRSLNLFFYFFIFFVSLKVGTLKAETFFKTNSLKKATKDSFENFLIDSNFKTKSLYDPIENPLISKNSLMNTEPDKKGMEKIENLLVFVDKDILDKDILERNSAAKGFVDKNPVDKNPVDKNPVDKNLVEEASFENKVKVFNEGLELLRKELNEKYQKASFLYKNNAKEKEFLALLKEIKEIKKNLFKKEKKWREDFSKESFSEESYAFWDQGNTTLSQLIIEYAAADYVYLIPPEISNLKISVFSSLPIPHECWEEMVELILINNGIGVKTLNPYLKQLFILKHNLSNVEAIASKEKDLTHFSDQSIIFFILKVKEEELKEVQNFFERFSDPKQTSCQIIKNTIVLVSSKKNIERLLALYKAVWKEKKAKKVKILSLKKLNAQEVENIIKSFFLDKRRTRTTSYFSSIIDELVIFPISSNSSIVLIGDGRMIEKAEAIIKELESQLEEPEEMSFFWYTCKHSDPSEIAEILSKVYSSLSKISKKKKKPLAFSNKDPNQISAKPSYSPVLPVTPSLVQPAKISKKKKKVDFENFTVDPKTGSILMIVKKKDLRRIRSLLKKLDVPKKMVQIDVLLVERKLQDRKQTGINILRIGKKGNKKSNYFDFDASPTASRKGILDFIFSKPKSSIPSLDLIISFLMAQEDLKINANPSILAVNQTPATISIVEELSINNGAVQVDTSSGITVEKSYTRAQFGITIVMTPTIHLKEEKSLDKKGYVTLDTNVTFDTTQVSENDRPPVTRRHIESEVRVADGETIILGGLRRKSQEDIRDKIPFLGDIPGIGKIFSTTKLTDSSTEMFIFITPRIIKDPIEGLKKEREILLQRRPGDIPEFLQKIEEAKKLEKIKIFENSLKVLF